MIAWIKPRIGGKSTLVKIHYRSCLGYGSLFVITVLKSPDTKLVGRNFILDSRSKTFNPYPNVVRRNANAGMYKGLPTCPDSTSRAYPII